MTLPDSAALYGRCSVCGAALLPSSAAAAHQCSRPQVDCSTSARAALKRMGEIRAWIIGHNPGWQVAQELLGTVIALEAENERLSKGWNNTAIKHNDLQIKVGQLEAENANLTARNEYWIEQFGTGRQVIEGMARLLGLAEGRDDDSGIVPGVASLQAELTTLRLDKERLRQENAGLTEIAIQSRFAENDRLRAEVAALRLDKERRANHKIVKWSDREDCVNVQDVADITRLEQQYLGDHDYDQLGLEIGPAYFYHDEAGWHTDAGVQLSNLACNRTFPTLVDAFGAVWARAALASQAEKGGTSE